MVSTNLCSNGHSRYFSIFDNIPFRRIKKVVFKLGGLKTKYIRFYSVLPNMEKKIFDKHMLKVKKLVRSL